ncbi:predicted protein [Thalassiosira pseudonana CCMP1335]|uniref:Uncharacterized protein n=1 Tax=Thalassiosira pseudonana TaxID=35128 RepID=B8BYK2_THAPS|nr:predicted protein [Thalassiosira pseudonana CCMP1335]EED93904.1 predicted protein [Thalassiosira pseudonana CCMP1335]
MSALTSLHRPIPITSLASRYGQLRPFQRKIALYGTVLELLNTLDFLTDEQRSHIMLRTQASGERLPMDLAWRRMKVLDKEIKTAILPKVKGLFEGGLGEGKTHDEICEMVLQSDYETVTEKTGTYPQTFEYNHYNIFLIYRIYYRGMDLDPDLFAPVAPYIEVPQQKPANMRDYPVGGLVGDISGIVPSPRVARASGGVRGVASFPNISNMKISYNMQQTLMEENKRRAMLKEVKDHTELLKEFEGIISDEELQNRKRALYEALPPVPPPFQRGGKGRKSGDGGHRHGKKAKASEAAASVVDDSALPAMDDDESWV